MPPRSSRAKKAPVKDDKQEIFDFFSDCNLHVLLEVGLKQAFNKFLFDKERNPRLVYIDALLRNRYFSGRQRSIEDYLVAEIAKTRESIRETAEIHETAGQSHKNDQECNCEMEECTAVVHEGEDLPDVPIGLDYSDEETEVTGENPANNSDQAPPSDKLAQLVKITDIDDMDTDDVNMNSEDSSSAMDETSQ